MRKEPIEVHKICCMFRPEPAPHCSALEDKYYLEYKKKGYCGTSKCPFFKPGMPGDGINIVRKEKPNGQVYFEDYERRETYD